MLMNSKVNENELNDSSDTIAMSILQEAKKFKDSLHRCCDYQDYETFKQKLHLYNCYGYEKQLADILGV